MNVWEIAILKCIEALGGNAALQHIYGALGKFKQLSPTHLKATIHGGRPAYQHQVRSHISNLCASGELVRMSRGNYSLTEKGRKRI
jgi:hypothetical protein